MPEAIKRGGNETERSPANPKRLVGNGNGQQGRALPRATRQHPKGYFASMFPGGRVPLPPEFGKKIIALEKLLRIPIWVIIHQGKCAHCGRGMEIEHDLFKAFQNELEALPQGQEMGILLESPGGDPHTAYRLGRLFQRRSKNQLTVIIPQFAKSAATLLALSASRLIVAENAELGPLDVQLFDPQREEYGSALDAVQSLERLHSVALGAIAQTMDMLWPDSGKRSDVLLPHVMNYVASFYRPLLEKIDTVDYTRKSRDLKVAEEYAIRLMGESIDLSLARQIASELVAKYPTHGFVIDRQEAGGSRERQGRRGISGLGLKIETFNASMNQRFEEIVADLIPYLNELPSVIGRVMHI
jgi:hypothetical protein